MITYLKGDATRPVGEDERKYIVHCVNNVGVWGKGFVMALSARWPQPEKRFRTRKPFLGDVDFVQVEEDITVINLYGQNGIRSKGNPVPVDYQAIQEGMFLVNKQLEMYEDSGITVSVHMPRMGCGLAGGKWEEIERILNLFPLTYYVYDL